MYRPMMTATVFACVLALVFSPLAGDEPVQSIFPDKNLEAAVRQQVFEKRNNDQPLTAKDVEMISTVRGVNKGIKDLAGLEHCTALASLDLAGNEITNLAPLAGLVRLQQIE